MNTVAKILCEIRPEANFSASNDYIEDGLLDSFDVITLVSDLDSAYSISIEGVDIIPENFKNQETIESLIKKYGINP